VFCNQPASASAIGTSTGVRDWYHNQYHRSNLYPAGAQPPGTGIEYHTGVKLTSYWQLPRYWRPGVGGQWRLQYRYSRSARIETGIC
jgi:hypothetical protein